MSEKIYTTTPENFKIFCRKLHKWVHLLGQHHWDIKVIHKDADNKDLDGPSYIQYNYESLAAQIGLAKTWPEKFTAKRADIAAFHEAMHLVLAALMETFDEGDEKVKIIALQWEHHVIANLERALFEPKSRG
jgi:hypothetical protein